MAVTGNFYNTLEFGGINSGDYGVYITGTGVYNAPARAVEMVSVPGRNGDVAVDMGHWDNIEVTYKCGLFGIDQSEMGEALMEFRNAIASQIGYQRLSDSYNPNEFRLGLFMAGLKFDAVSRNRAGEFELKFNCKPQRFLTDGEEMIDIRTDWSDLKTASGEVVTFEVEDDAAANYTQFKSLVADIEPVQSGSGTPSPDNVRPISGWDSVEATVAGENLYDAELLQGYWAFADGSRAVSNGWVCTDKIPCNPSTGYTVSASPKQTRYQGFVWFDANGAFISSTASERVADIGYTATSPSNAGFMAFNIAGATYGETIEPSDVDGFRVGLEASTKEYTAEFSETVYGGTVDIVSGALTVDRAMVTFDGSSDERWNLASTYTIGGQSVRSCATQFDEIKQGEARSGIISNAFVFHAYSISEFGQFTNIYWNNDNLEILLPNMTTAQEYRDYLADNPLQVVYKLATPRTIQLDPQTISTLVGVNSVWGDGDVSLEYGVRPGVLINPTQYESQPLLEIEGTGDVSLNDYVIAIDGGSVGEVELASERRVEPIMGGSYPSTITETIDMATTMSMLEDGDAFNISTLTASWLMGNTTSETYTITQQPTDGTASIETATSPRVSAVARFSQLEFAKGEANTFAEEFIVSGQSSRGTGSVTFSVDVDYDGSHTLTISYGVAIHPTITGVLRSGSYSDIGAIIGNSSKQTFSGQVIIDSETGDAYRIEDGTYISLNKYIQLGAQLPTLRPGANIITYDDTITSLKIAPRWWRL